MAQGGCWIAPCPLALRMREGRVVVRQRDILQGLTLLVVPPYEAPAAQLGLRGRIVRCYGAIAPWSAWEVFQSPSGVTQMLFGCRRRQPQRGLAYWRSILGLGCSFASGIWSEGVRHQGRTCEKYMASSERPRAHGGGPWSDVLGVDRPEVLFSTTCHALLARMCFCPQRSP